MSAPSSPAEARSLVDKISEDHGWIPDDIFNEMSERAKLVVRRAMKTKDAKIASAVTTLAKNLYTSSSRFVFELLQNADDNAYTEAQKGGQDPFLSFRVSPTQIVLECNEDGFTNENLVAICDIGRSSKKGAQGFIGEKGIGFKSVFMAAWKVEIRSGHLSFCFQHRHGDSGMGMISPIWLDPNPGEDVPEGVTRMTLHLHDTGDAATIDAQRESIRRQFSELQDTTLLFLKNLKRIRVDLLDGDGTTTESTTYSHSTPDGPAHRETVKKTTVGKDATAESVKYYHITRHVATNLAKNENREYTKAEEAEKAYSRATVVLAFPITDDAVPIIEDQKVFAFLPVRKEGFKFVIQSDFVTQANREDIVTTSQRNKSLVQGIADAFLVAVRQFCDDKDLQYTWMRYLPLEGDHPWNDLWALLVPALKTKLSDSPILRMFGKELAGLCSIEGSRKFTLDFLDENEQPLLEDIEPGIYLSTNYQRADLSRLSGYGLQAISFQNLMDRLRADLRRRTSRVHSEATSQDWHERLAKLLCYPFEKNWPGYLEALRSLNLLPTLRGQDESDNTLSWVSAASTVPHLYYPAIGDVSIPRGLDNMYLLDGEAIKNSSRRRVFDNLGAKTATGDDVRSRIVRRYQVCPVLSEPMLSFLEFLYQTHEKSTDKLVYRPVVVLCRRKISAKPATTDVYFRDEEPCGAYELLRPIENGQGETTPDGRDLVNFLDDDTFNHEPASLPAHGLSWVEWLESALGIRRHHRLLLNDDLSPAYEHVATYRPDRFLDFLRVCWAEQKAEISKSPSHLEAIRNTEVMCVGNKRVALKDTWLPLPSLRKRCSQYLKDETAFPFLELDEDADEAVMRRKWQILHTAFQTKASEGIAFYLAILEAVKTSGCIGGMVGIIEIYRLLYGKLLQSDPHDLATLRTMFESQKLLACPSAPESSEHIWVDPRGCLWKAPASMQSKHPLQPMLGPGTPGHSQALTTFICETLGVRDCTWMDITGELAHRRASLNTDLKTATEMYSWLIDMNVIGIEKRKMKDTFAKERLIFVPGDSQRQWYTVSECLWSSATEIRGKVALESHYQRKKGFFVDVLGVQTLSAEMVYDDLRQAGTNSDVTIDEVKEKIRVLNSFFSTGKVSLDPSPIFEGRLFPVRYPHGAIQLVSANTEFAIVDRQLWEDAFRNKVRMLDLSLSEVQKLKPFLTWVGLEDRYLSVTVEERSELKDHVGAPIVGPRKAVKPKAHALYRIAIHFGSPRGRGLYNVLKNVSVYEADMIFSTARLLQDGKAFTHDVPRGDSGVHIQEDPDTRTSVFVPKDPSKQSLAYRTSLPRRLLKWMMTDPSTGLEHVRASVDPAAISALKSVLTADSTDRNLMSDILTEEGVAEAEFSDDYEPETIVSISSLEIQARTATPGTECCFGSELEGPEYETPASSVLSPGPPVTRRQYHGSGFQVPAMAYDRFSSPSPRSDTLDRRSNLLDAQAGSERFRQLLNKVVENAASMTIPDQGAFGMSSLLASLPSDTAGSAGLTDIWHKSQSQFDYNCKIGAAGELLVFELLSRLDPPLPGFSIANWRSTIREHVNSHASYRDLRNWEGQETSDIVYQDVQGGLTQILIDKGYLDSKLWSNKRPQYFIEIKATPGSCETQFYMSHNQYNMMQSKSNGQRASGRQDVIYVIFRVFNLDDRIMGLRVYVDPEVLRQKGDLVFSGASWAITPSS